MFLATSRLQRPASKSERRRRARGSARDGTQPATASIAPPVEAALSGLVGRTVRAVVFVFVRLVGLALLVSVLAARSPWIEAHRAYFDAGAALLVVLPFFTALGRIFGWRIALGRAYVREGRWAEAERALAPFARRRWTYHPFDAAGEGAYWLAVARQQSGQGEPACRLFDLVARHGSALWRTQAQQAAATASPVPDAADAP